MADYSKAMNSLLTEMVGEGTLESFESYGCVHWKLAGVELSVLRGNRRTKRSDKEKQARKEAEQAIFTYLDANKEASFSDLMRIKDASARGVIQHWARLASVSEEGLTEAEAASKALRGLLDSFAADKRLVKVKQTGFKGLNIICLLCF